MFKAPLRIKNIALKSSYRISESMESVLGTRHLPRGDKSKGLLARLAAMGYSGYGIPLDHEILKKERDWVASQRQQGAYIEGYACITSLESTPMRDFIAEHLTALEVFIDHVNESTVQLCHEIKKIKIPVYFSLILTRKLYKSPKVQQLFKELDGIHLYFPYKWEAKGGLTNSEASTALKRLEEGGLRHKMLPPRKTLFDSRCVLDTKEEYFWSPRIDTSDADKPVEFSVIIPCFNNHGYLMKTLENFAQQTTSSSDYEVIVVDDGSDIEQVFEFEQWLKDFVQGGIQLKYIYSPRFAPRKMGDGRYRAGISRNLGVSHSKGSIYCFLDSDILVSPEYLEHVRSTLEHSDVVQFKRYDLSATASRDKNFYSDILPEDLIYEDVYWDRFNEDKSAWSSISNGWKYTCTHSLSLRSEVFREQGWILPCFIYYGFEDTELGYRLWREGLKFAFGPSEIYHLYHKPERSEFFREKWKRDKILAKTAEIFFRHQPRPEIFEMFQSYLR